MQSSDKGVELLLSQVDTTLCSPSSSEEEDVSKRETLVEEASTWSCLISPDGWSTYTNTNHSALPTPSLEVDEPWEDAGFA